MAGHACARAQVKGCAATTMVMPMLALQGEREHGVTMAEIGAWRAAVATRADVGVESCSMLERLFITGDGPGSPAVSRESAHVDDAAVRDIRAWITSDE